MEKLKFETPDMVAGNIEKIGALFPAAITEMRGEDGQIKKGINFEVLKQLLSRDVVDGDECYEFTWVGKKAAMAEAARPITKTLRPVKEDSRDWDTTQNLYIEGDNLEVLKILQESYLGKVKLIYIDPPYNTGSDRFIYPDNYVLNQDEYDEFSGRHDDDDYYLFKENNVANPRFHSVWASMIKSRLIAARNLLSDDGAIFIQIDEGELFNLKQLSDEVFGASCFLNVISVKTKVAGVSGSYMGKSLQNNTEYILFYCKNPVDFKIDNLPKKRQELMEFIDSYEREGKSWKYTSVLKSVDEGNYVKSITAGNGDKIKIYKHNSYEILPINKIAAQEFSGDIKNAYYAYIQEIFRTTNAQTSIRTRVIQETADIESDLISIEYIPTKGKNAGQATRIFYKDRVRNMVTYLREVVSIEKAGIFKLDNAGNLWDDINYNNLASEAGVSFPNGQKPVQLISRLLQMFDDQDMTILDFFSGSATTAHSVMQLNAEDGGHRKFIMVQLPEPCDEKKTGYKNICEIGKERIRRAGDKIKADNPLGTQNLDTGFRVFRVDSSNMKDVYYQPEELEQQSMYDLVSNIKDDRTDMDLLYACLLDWGVEIHLPHTSTDLDGCTVHNVDNGALMACFSPNVPRSVVEYMAKQQPLRAVFRDSAFASDDAKINVTEIFKNLSPDTKVKVI